MDYTYDDFTHPGYYMVTYGGPVSGPYYDVPEMAYFLGLRDYPDNGYVVYWDGSKLGSVPSLNPDDLLDGQDEMV